jgi:DNA-directed RNA polymerase subunit beta'
MNPEVNKITLGSGHKVVSPEALIDASIRLLNINKGTEKPDERDSLIFKNIYAPDDLLKEYFNAHGKTIQRKLQNSLRNRDQVGEVVASNVFTKPLRNFFTTSDLSSTPPQTNPVAMLTNARKTTSMGEGGIRNMHSITMETRDVQPSHFGFLDPLSTPESLKVGVSVGLGSEVHKKGNEMVTPVVMPDGKIEDKSPMDFYNSTVGFPDQFTMKNGKPKALFKKVKAMKNHKPAEVKPSEVDFYLRSPQSMFDFGANLVPFLSTTQGNRASTAGRMITQALPLDNPEAPLTTVNRDGESTYEDFMGTILLPTLSKESGKDNVGGTVDKITDEYIHIKGDDGEDYKVGLYKDFPLNQDGFLNTSPIVKEGDKVKPKDLLAKSNFTDDKGRLALGKNLTVAYISYKGNSFEDGATITESAAKKLSHSSIDRINVFFTPKLSVFDKKRFRALFPEELPPSNSDKLDEQGLPKPGEKFQKGETLAAFLVKKEVDDLDASLKKLNKAIYTPYSKNVTVWDEEDVGEVVEVRKTGRNIDIYVKSVHPFKGGDKLCVDEETEFLTDKGWKSILELKGSEKFCTLNPNGELIEYQEAQSINIYDHEGPMYKIANTTIDQLVTLGHKMYVKPRNPLNSGYGLFNPKDIFGKRVRYSKSGKWFGEDLVIPSEIQHEIDALDFASFMGWFLSEGNTNKTPKGYVTTIHQSLEINPINYKEIVNLLKRMNLTPIEQKDRITFNSKSFYYYLKPFGKSFQKFVPDAIKESDSEYIEAFLDAYCKGDGSINNSGQKVYITSSLKMRDDLMELILKNGMAANYTLASPAGTRVFEYFSNYDCWNIREIKTKLYPQVNHGHVHDQNAQEEDYIHYEGKVGCPTTPNGIVYIRRNGKTSWTGNSSRYGDKHIVGKIIPDDEAPHRPDGTPVEIMVNPQGVQGRMNMGQLLDTAMGKLSKKTGKVYDIKNFNNPEGDEAKRVLDLMKKEGVEPNEKLRDGKNGDYIENPIFVGNRQYLKLRHLVKKKMGAHDFGTYDIDEQPAGKGAQKMGEGVTYSYLAHGAKNLLREATTIKGRKNEEWFRNVQFGLAPPKPSGNFVFDKMLNYLKAAGVDVKKEGNGMQLIPLIDKKTLELSNGEITKPADMLIGKNLEEKKGGLFDKKLTGGSKGEKYNHISLPVELPNPMAESAIKSILELTNKGYDNIMSGKEELNGNTGAAGIISSLKSLDIKKELKSTKELLRDAPPTNVNKLNTKVRILDALDQQGLNAKDAYVIKNVLTLPPKFRPIYALPSGDLQVSDINKHYRDIGLKAVGLKNAIDEDIIDDEEKVKYENGLYYSVKAMQGFVDPITYGKQKYKGALKELGNTKGGIIFGKAWGKRQDLSGRSTITPEPSLGLDEVGIPEEMAWTIFKPFVVRKLKERGITASNSLKSVNERDDQGKQALLQVMKEKPVIMNRAPSLHKHSVQAAKAQLSSGKDIRINPLIVSGFNADFDGDTMSIMVPATYEGEQDAKSMFPSRILFKHGDRGLVPSVSQEYVYGISKLSELNKKTGKTFKSINEAKEAGLKMTDQFSLNGQNMTLGQWELNKKLPEKYKDYSRVFKGSDLSKLLDKIARSEPNDVFADVINHYKDLGALYSYKIGGTISIDDMVIDRKYRENLIKKWEPKIKKIKDDQKKIEAYLALNKDIGEAQDKQLKGKNRMLELIETGALSKSKSGNVKQVLSGPGIVTDTNGNPIPIPIFKSYSEGLDTFSYFNTFPGVRKGIVDRSVNTQQSGALNKTLLSVNRRQLIVEEDCGTTEGITLKLSDNNVLDRTALNTVRGVVKRGEIIDSRVINNAKEKGMESLEVRSPLTCDSSEGICQKCYGTLPDGQLPNVGTNVGILDSQALTERSTQLTMKTFHTGGAAGGKKDVASSFPRLEQLLKVPQKVSGKATLAPISGSVSGIKKNDIGGWELNVGSKKLTIHPGRELLVSEGNNVKKGEALTDGVIKPQELGELKSHLEAQKYIVDEISGVYDNDFHKKSIETVVRGISDNAEITEAPDDSGFYRGDKTTESYLKKLNRERQANKMEPIKYKPYFKSVDTLNVDSNDWLTRITTNRIKDGLSKGMAKGQWADIAGKDPIPAYIYGDDFGDPKKKGKDEGGFY